MNETQRNELIETLMWVCNGWTREAFDAMDDVTLLRHYEEKVGVV